MPKRAGKPVKLTVELSCLLEGRKPSSANTGMIIAPEEQVLGREISLWVKLSCVSTKTGFGSLDTCTSAISTFLL